MMNTERKKTMRLYVTLTEEERRAVKAKAAAQGRTLHAVITAALRAWLQAQPDA